MNSEEMKRILASRGAKVNRFLSEYPVSLPDIPERLNAAMQYSLNAGGKRLRPVLCMASAALCGLSEDRVLPFAAAIEMIHTYSLIHDDLPAMDNDDLRRGLPSSHRKFDEATAILAGDGLLTDAFAIISAMDLPSGLVLAALNELARGAGSPGMVGGQMLDMQYTGLEAVTLEQVARMQALKTGALLTASCLCGAILADAPADLRKAMASYGACLGRAFQIADDILDITGTQEALGKPVGSDEKSGKNTYPSCIGLEASRRLAGVEASRAKAALPDHPEADFLAALADYVVERSA